MPFLLYRLSGGQVVGSLQVACRHFHYLAVKCYDKRFVVVLGPLYQAFLREAYTSVYFALHFSNFPFTHITFGHCSSS